MPIDLATMLNLFKTFLLYDQFCLLMTFFWLSPHDQLGNLFYNVNYLQFLKLKGTV